VEQPRTAAPLLIQKAGARFRSPHEQEEHGEENHFEGGVNFIVGARRPSGMFLEMKATAYGVSNVRLLMGFNF
jgi:hypothetical protein